MFIFLYWISRSFTEGYKWSDRKYTAAEYHLWRLVEVIAIFVAILLCGGVKNLIAWNLIGIFFYERILMKIADNRWFKKPGTIFDIGIKIKRYPYQDWIILITGIGVLFV